MKQTAIRALCRRITAENELGLPARLRQSTVDPDSFIASSKQPNHESRLELEERIGKLRWREFEFLCAYVLRAHGISKCFPMRGSKEEGIDLFGVCDLGIASSFSIWHGTRIRLLGQAKKGNVGQQAVRLFSRDINSFVKGEGKAFDLVPPWFRKLETPVVGFIMTANDFTRPAKTWADSHGINLRNRSQIAQDIVNKAEAFPGLTKRDGAFLFDTLLFDSFIDDIEARLDRFEVKE